MQTEMVYGGNRVQYANLTGTEDIPFEKQPYTYGSYFVAPTRPLNISGLQSFTAYVVDASKECFLTVEGIQQQLRVGDALQGEAQHATTIHCSHGTARLFVAGISRSATPIQEAPRLVITHAENLRRVNKPWGYELWINGEHPGYALKQIFIRAPHRTSLQYHNQKSETIVIVQGDARLHYKKTDPALPYSDPQDIDSTPLKPGSVVSVTPPTLHRMEAYSDITMIEASTPHLHDVVRVSDDANRPDGHIPAEHRAV